MSLLNVSITPDKALVSVDTAMGFADGGNGMAGALRALNDGTIMHTSKMQFLSHLGAAFATRGDALAGNLAFSQLCLTSVQTFEEAIEAMPDILERVYAQAIELRRQQFGIGEPQGLEVVLVGWSAKLYRMDGWRWSRYPDADQFTARRINRTLLLPGARWDTPPVPDTASEMDAVARAEVDYVRAEHSDMTVGGRLLLAELTRDGFSLRTIADLEAAPDDVHELVPVS